MSLNLEVQILGEFKNLTKATKGAAKQLTGLRNSARTIARQINSAFALVGVGLSFRALTNGIQGAISQASNLEESINAVRVSFGPASDAILALGENSAKSFGIARSEFNQAAVTFSAFVDELVGPGEDASDIIETLTQRGADFASVYNIDVAEALRVFRSGLSGESEPLKRFGIILNDTAVKQFAYSRRIAETGRELTNQQKVIARYQLLLEETNKVQGDFANTSGSFANAQRILRASFQDVSASIGNGFTPALAAAATFITTNIEVFNELGRAVGERLAKAFEQGGDAATTFGGKLIKLVEDFTAFIQGSTNEENVFVKISNDIGPLLNILGGLGEILKGIIAIIDGFVDGLFGWIPALTGAGGASLTFGDILKGIGKFLQDVGYWVGWVASLFVPLGQGILIVGRGIVSFLRGGKGFLKIFEDIGGVINNTKNALIDFSRGLLNAEGKFMLFGLALKGDFAAITKANEVTKQKFDEYTKRLDAQDGRRIRNYVDVITTNFTQTGGTIPASPTRDNRPAGPLQPGYTERFINYRDGNQWYTRTWTGYGWKITKDADAYRTPAGSGSGDNALQTRLKAVVATLQDALEDAKERIKTATESFRDAVGLSFGLITNNITARFSVSRIIAQMKRIKDVAKNFAKDIAELRKQGADASLIDELIGLGPLGGATAASSLLKSGQLGEFLQLRKDLSAQGAAVGGAANFGIYGTSTSGLQSAIDALNKTIAAGKGATYNINVANPNVTPQQIIAAIKDYERKTKKKVLR